MSQCLRVENYRLDKSESLKLWDPESNSEVSELRSKVKKLKLLQRYCA